MSGRELVILLIGFAAVAAVLHGLYIALKARRGQIKLAIDRNIPQDVNLDELEMSELPGGGARVVERSLDLVNLQNSALEAASIRADAIGLGATSANHTDEDQSSIPVLMDAVELAEHEDDLLAEDNIEEGFLDNDEVDESDTDADSILFDYGEQSLSATPQVLNTDAYNSLQSIAPNYDDEEGLGESTEGFTEDSVEKDIFNKDIINTTNIHEEKFHEESLNEENRIENSADEFDDSSSRFGDQSSNTQSKRENLEGDGNQSQKPGLHYEELDGSSKDIDEELNEGFVDERREEPALGSVSDIEDDLDDFSMTAGERIGFENTSSPAPKANIVSDNDEMVLPVAGSLSTTVTTEGETNSEQPSDAFQEDEFQDIDEQQASLFDEYQEDDEEPPGQSGIGSLRQSLFSAFSRKPKTKEATPIAVDVEQVVREDTLSESSGEELTDGSLEQNESHIYLSEVLVLNVMARDGYHFAGDDLLQVLITSGLKFGEMNIFHHRQGNEIKGPVIFSVANILNPGTFDLNSMEEFSTLGVSLFLALPTAINNLEALEQMLRVAQQIRGALDGELRDDSRNIMTAQTTEHYRQRVRDFELRQLKAASNRS
ncbi:MAG TPA: cell division protein ZipA [Porticoccaceae bacterium]|jgi:cell division protein ZipA|nr:cell division protein ZipA [Gammaproteobacteria bacterium]HIL59407.1 cell division protein ZipA [Porticoccaceae bacterium]